MFCFLGVNTDKRKDKKLFHLLNVFLLCANKLSFMKNTFSCICSKLCIRSGSHSVCVCVDNSNLLVGLLGQWCGVSET